MENWEYPLEGLECLVPHRLTMDNRPVQKQAQLSVLLQPWVKWVRGTCGLLGSEPSENIPVAKIWKLGWRSQLVLAPILIPRIRVFDIFRLSNRLAVACRCCGQRFFSG